MGDEVQVMPCSGKHVFHPPCLAPWLADNNSCPTCRHELPTDDMQVGGGGWGSGVWTAAVDGWMDQLA